MAAAAERRRAIRALVPTGLNSDDRARLETLVGQAYDALVSGNDAAFQQVADQARTLLQAPTGRPRSTSQLRKLDDSVWNACADYCFKLHSGDPKSYAFCYFVCVVFGGPPKPAQAPGTGQPLPPVTE